MTNMLLGYILELLVVYATSILCIEHPDGVSQISRTQDPSGNYQFSYTVNTAEGEHFRREGTDPLGRIVGTYGLTHADGRKRIVDYVADKDGFQAQVRSNEMKSDANSPLETAASDTNESYGTRLKSTASRVAYVRPNAPIPRPGPYRPEIALPDYVDVRPNPHLPRPGPYRPEIAAPSYPDVYFPPIDPHATGRRPNLPTRSSYRPATTSIRPFVPPYGGFDDDPPPRRVPGIRLPSPPSSFASHPSSFGSPSSSSFGSPPSSSFGSPPSSSFGSPPATFGVARPLLFQQREIPNQNPNLVLRALPIPNGIQAVRIDPTTGRVHERLAYPLYPRRYYNRDILLHNDDITDENDERTLFRHYDIPLRRRLSLRGTGDNTISDTWPNNDTYPIDENNLSRPSAKDLDSVYKQIASLDGYGDEGPYEEDIEYRPPASAVYADDLENEPLGNDPQDFGPYSEVLSSYRSPARLEDDEFSRFFRQKQLTPVDSKELALSSSDKKASQTQPNTSEIEQE